MKPLIYDFSLEELQQWAKDNGEPAFRGGQIFDWLYVKRVNDFESMSNLSKALRAKLVDQFSISALTEITKLESKDGTVKFLFGLHDDHAIETVIMKHNYGNSVCDHPGRLPDRMYLLCIYPWRSQAGSDCREIVAQVVRSQQILDARGERVSSIVIMGTGEPFENYDATMRFLRLMIHEKGLNIGQRHITVSTSGIVPNIYKFADEDTQINLAISIHAPNDTLRSKLMPVNRRYPFDDVIESLRYYQAKTGRRISFEYALIGGVNDQKEHAEELAGVLKTMLCHVNLIPVNHVPERKYVRTSRNDIFEFQRILADHGVNVTIRREQGHDIAAACGQLRAKHMELG